MYLLAHRGRQSKRFRAWRCLRGDCLKGKGVEGAQEGPEVTPYKHTQQATQMNLWGLRYTGRGMADWTEIRTLGLYSWRFRDSLKRQQMGLSFLSGFSYSWGGAEGHGCDAA